MSASENQLLSFLFDEGRELKNLKFFPGPECASSDQLYEAAHAAISAAIVIENANMIPVGSEKIVSVAEFVESL